MLRTLLSMTRLLIGLGLLVVLLIAGLIGWYSGFIPGLWEIVVEILHQQLMTAEVLRGLVIGIIGVVIALALVFVLTDL